MIKIDRVLGYNVGINIPVQGGSFLGFMPKEDSGLSQSAIRLVISPTNKQTGVTLTVLDCRPDSLAFLEAINDVKLAKKLNPELVNMAAVVAKEKAINEKWPEFFNLPAQVNLYTEEVNGRIWPVIVLENPRDQKADGLLAATSFVTGTGLGSFSTKTHYNGERWIKTLVVKGSGDSNHVTVITFTTSDSPITVTHWQELDGQLTKTDFSMRNQKSVWRLTAQILTKECVEGMTDDAEAEEVEHDSEQPISSTPLNSLDFQFTEVELDALEGKGITTIELLAASSRTRLGKFKIARARAETMIRKATEFMKPAIALAIEAAAETSAEPAIEPVAEETNDSEAVLAAVAELNADHGKAVVHTVTRRTRKSAGK